MIVSLHEMLDSAGVPHQFGGAIALAWYRNPRATTDIDVNLTLPPEAAEPVLGLLGLLGVTVTPEDRAAIARTARPGWTGAARISTCSSPPWTCTSKWPSAPAVVRFGPVDIPILAPEDLIVCKAIFDRPKDWLDIEEMLRWGTEVDADPDALLGGRDPRPGGRAVHPPRRGAGGRGGRLTWSDRPRTRLEFGRPNAAAP